MQRMRFTSSGCTSQTSESLKEDLEAEEDFLSAKPPVSSCPPGAAGACPAPARSRPAGLIAPVWPPLPVGEAEGEGSRVTLRASSEGSRVILRASLVCASPFVTASTADAFSHLVAEEVSVSISLSRARSLTGLPARPAAAGLLGSLPA
jgi:hypothetical protein